VVAEGLQKVRDGALVNPVTASKAAPEPKPASGS
jgi:hypothetical protein